ncbi:MAG TPA: molecular chaperone HtpG [Steroidobacteraceae bacterium]|nr:molecular chaperone HtpG [Steroidobacteraceae bacterium]
MSATAPDRETRGFQAEVKQLLKLMVHSLYSHREIFLRELISNAADAADKLRFEALARPELLSEEPELAIRVDYDAKQGTLTITDNGIGMSRAEIVEQLGTIAKSGTAEFFSRLTGEQQQDSRLIGQFGVGFYSAFIVANRVEVASRKAGLPAAEGVRWESTGEGEFNVETVTRAQRGTSVTLHLKPDAREFADGLRLRGLVRRYSDHIAIPVRMPKEGAASLDYETVNHAQALWTRPRSEVTDEEYREFYAHVSHDHADPLAWSHNKVEGKREYTSLLYLPAHAPFDLWQREGRRGVKLYVRRVFIMDDAEQLLPLYLRFIKGVVDCGDLPLNVSRELLQQVPEIESMRGALTRRVLDLLAKLASDEAEKYQTFWNEFGRVLKEGLAEDPANQERIAKLLRFSTTHTERAEQDQSLEHYRQRMPAGQERIFYVVGEDFAAARSSPHLEIYRRKGIEVLLLSERLDEWLVGHLPEFDGKRLHDITRGDLALGSLLGEAEQKLREADLRESKNLLRRVKEALGERVSEVRVSSRLTDSPACLVLGEHDLSRPMQKLLEASGQKPPASKPALELNVQHALVRHLESLDAERFSELALVLFDQALLADGARPEEPAEFVRRLNRLLLSFGEARPADAPKT